MLQLRQRGKKVDVSARQGTIDINMSEQFSPQVKTESKHRQQLRQNFEGLLDNMGDIDDIENEEDDHLYAMEVSDRQFAEKQSLKQQLLSTEQQLTETQQKLTEAEKAAFIDSLTGCYNQNYWINYINSNPDPTRDNGQLIIFSADVNELKFANDAFGYDAGNLLLQYAAGQLRRLFPRSDDIIIRWGGDEFIVLCHDHNANKVSPQKIIDTVSERLRLDRENPNTPSVDIGLGASFYIPPVEDTKGTENERTRSECIEDAKNQADNAMKFNKYLVANADEGKSPDISVPSDYHKALAEDPEFATYLERSRLPKEPQEAE